MQNGYERRHLAPEMGSHEPKSVAPSRQSLWHLLKKVPDLVGSVEVAICITEETWSLHGRVGNCVTAALDRDEFHHAPARDGPALPFSSAAIIRIAI